MADSYFWYSLYSVWWSVRGSDRNHLF